MKTQEISNPMINYRRSKARKQHLRIRTEFVTLAGQRDILVRNVQMVILSSQTLSIIIFLTSRRTRLALVL